MTRSADSKNLEAHGDEVLVVLEETTKEAAEWVVEANIDTAVGKPAYKVRLLGQRQRSSSARRDSAHPRPW
jgi:hypothetical protein